MILKSFILIAFLFIFFVLFFGVIIGSILRGVLSLLFGKRTTKRFHSETYSSQNSTSETFHSTPKKSKGEKTKVFDDDEGEYVEFEEIKD